MIFVLGNGRILPGGTGICGRYQEGLNYLNREGQIVKKGKVPGRNKVPGRGKE